MLYLDSPLMDAAVSEPWCSQCHQLREQLDTVNREHLVNFKALKEKIYSTDLLIKKYNTKCREFDAQSKKLEETSKRVEAYQRDLEVMTSKFKSTLEQIEPLNQAKEKLDKKKNSLEKQVEQLTNQVTSSELIQKQYLLNQQKLEKDMLGLEQDEKQMKQTVKNLEASLKKAESAQKRLQDDQELKRQALAEQKKSSAKLAKTNQKLENQLAKCEELLRFNGLHVDFKKIVKRGGIASSEVCSITSSIAHTADWLSDEDSPSESDEDVERIFAQLGFGVGKPGSAGPSSRRNHLLKPICPALSPLPCSPAPSKADDSSDSEEEESSGYHDDEDTVCSNSGNRGNSDTMDTSQQPGEKVGTADAESVEKIGTTKPSSKALTDLTRFQRNAELAARASKLRSQRVRKLVTTDDSLMSRKHSKTVVMKGGSLAGDGEPRTGSSGIERHAVQECAAETNEETDVMEEAESVEGTPMFSPRRRTSRVCVNNDESRRAETVTSPKSLDRKLSKQTTGSFNVVCAIEADEMSVKLSPEGRTMTKHEISGVNVTLPQPHKDNDTLSLPPPPVGHVDLQVERDLEISTSEDEMSPMSPRMSPRLSPRQQRESPKSPRVSKKVDEMVAVKTGENSSPTSSQRRSSPRLFSRKSSCMSPKSDTGRPGLGENLEDFQEPYQEEENVTKGASCTESSQSSKTTVELEQPQREHLETSVLDLDTHKHMGRVYSGAETGISARTRTRSLTKCNVPSSGGDSSSENVKNETPQCSDNSVTERPIVKVEDGKNREHVGKLSVSETDSQATDDGGSNSGETRIMVRSRTRTQSLTKYMASSGNDTSNSETRSDETAKLEASKPLSSPKCATVVSLSEETSDNENNEAVVEVTEDSLRQRSSFKEPFPVVDTMAMCSSASTSGNIEVTMRPGRRVTRSKSLPGYVETPGRGHQTMGPLKMEKKGTEVVHPVVDTGKGQCKAEGEGQQRETVPPEQLKQWGHQTRGTLKTEMKGAEVRPVEDTGKGECKVNDQGQQSENVMPQPLQRSSVVKNIVVAEISTQTKKKIISKKRSLTASSVSERQEKHTQSEGLRSNTDTSKHFSPQVSKGDKIKHTRLATNVTAAQSLDPESPCYKILANVKTQDEAKLGSTTAATTTLPYSSPRGMLGGLPSAISPLPPTPLRKGSRGDDGKESGHIEMETTIDCEVKPSTAISSSEPTRTQRTTRLIDALPPPLTTARQRRRRGRRLKEAMEGREVASQEGQEKKHPSAAGESGKGSTQGEQGAVLQNLEECSKEENQHGKKQQKKKAAGLKPLISFVKGENVIPGTIEGDFEKGPRKEIQTVGDRASNTGRIDMWCDEAHQGPQGTVAQQSPGVSDASRKKKERHKKKRKKDAATTDESSPPKKALIRDSTDESGRQYVNIIDRELQSLERPGPVDLTQTGQHLTCLQAVVETRVYADRILQLLERSEADLLMSEVRGQLKKLEGDLGILSKWKPTVTQLEERLVELLVLTAEKMPQLPDVFLRRTADAIVHSDTLHVLAKSALCRIYASLCQKLGQVERLWVLVYDLTYFKVTGVYALLANCASVWPEALKKNTTFNSSSGSEQLLITVLQFIFLKNQWFRGTPKQTVVISALKQLCYWEHTEMQDVHLVTMVINKIESLCEQNDGHLTKSETDDLFACVQSLRLLAVHKGWTWTYTCLIQGTVWPKVKDLAVHRGNDPGHVTWTRLQWMCKLLGSLVVLCPQNEKQKLDEILKSLQHFFSGERDISVPLPTQVSVLEVVMLLTPYHAVLATDICQKWLRRASEGDVGDRGLEIDRVKDYLNYYKQRLPHITV